VDGNGRRSPGSVTRAVEGPEKQIDSRPPARYLSGVNRALNLPLLEIEALLLCSAAVGF